MPGHYDRSGIASPALDEQRIKKKKKESAHHSYVDHRICDIFSPLLSSFLFLVSSEDEGQTASGRNILAAASAVVKMICSLPVIRGAIKWVVIGISPLPPLPSPLRGQELV